MIGAMQCFVTLLRLVMFGVYCLRRVLVIVLVLDLTAQRVRVEPVIYWSPILS